jgi:SEC-C motif-containing protein
MILFKAYFTNAVGKECIHVERSLFEKLSDKWYYVSGEFEE